MTRRVLLGLGSNLGDRRAQLRRAVAEMPDLVAVSSLWETAPVGGPEQGAFLNAVVQLETDRSPRELLLLCRELEMSAERVRSVHWGPRTLDVDVLWIDGETVAEPDLIIPHPLMFERPFVLVPLGELAPDLVPDDFEAPATDEVWSYESSSWIDASV